MSMSPWMADIVLTARKQRIKRYNNVRFHKNGFEYKLVYDGGFFGFLTAYRRPEWKPRGRFEYVDTFSEDDLGMDDVIGFIKDKVK